MNRAIAALMLLALLLISGSPAFAQFAQIGRNKIVYGDFDWHVYASPHFDVYYYPEEEAFLEQMVSFAESSYLTLSKVLDHEPQFRIPLIYYRTHGEFEQTNVTTELIDEGTGAFTSLLKPRIVIPIDRPADFLYKILEHELVHVFELSILYDNSPGRVLRSAAPGWLIEGLASYLAKDERSVDIMVIRDAVVNGIIPPISQVQNAHPIIEYRYGHAVFDFIEQEFGAEGIRTFLNEFRKVLVGGNIEKPIKESFGIEADEFDRRFRRYLLKKYVPLLLENNEPEDHGKEIGIKLPGVVTMSPALSPSGELIAALTNKKEELDLVIINAKDGEMIRNLTRGFTNSYDFLVSSVFEGKNDLSWSPGGDEVAVFARRGNKRILLVFNAVTGKKVLEKVMDVDTAESPAFSPEGDRLLFSGNKAGQVDIFEYHLKTGVLTNITNDPFYDSNPSWSADGKTVLFNRRINAYEKIFLLEYDDPAQKTQVTFGETSDIQPSFSRDGKKLYYSSDAGEHQIFNIYSLDLETGEVRQYTDVISGHFTPRELPEEDGKKRLVSGAFWRLGYRLYTVDLDKPVKIVTPAERQQEPPDIKPFAPSLTLTVDEAGKQPFASKSYHLETAPTVGVGIASDSSIVGNAYLVFSDLLGDHRFWIATQSIANFTNTNIGYMSLKNRLKWFASVTDYRDFVVLPTAQSGRFVKQQANRVTGAQGGVSYPFSAFSRVDASLGVLSRDVISTDLLTFTDPNSGRTFGELSLKFEGGTSPIVEVSFVNDTARFKGFGPWHGRRLNLSAQSAPSGGGELGTFTEYNLDVRTYARLSSRSLFAWRLFGRMSSGEGSQFFGIGGLDQLRGYRYREFLGDRAAFMNFELRFPLVSELRLPWADFGEIRGIAFLDVGSAWTQDGLFFDKETGFFRNFKFYDKGEKRFKDGRASYGLGFSTRVPWLFGPLELNWTFSRRLPFGETRVTTQCVSAFGAATNPEERAAALGLCPVEEENDARWRSDFYFGYTF